MPDHAVNINLLPHKEESFVVQFLNWALTVGRVLVIVTELLALLTFLYRFSLDRQLIDLHDKIKYERTIVENLQGNEKIYRDLQNSLSVAKSLDTQSSLGGKLFTDVVTMARGNVRFSDLIITTNSVRMKIHAFSVQSLNTFINKLKEDKDLGVIRIDQIENRTASSVIAVTITATLKSAETPTSGGGMINGNSLNGKPGSRQAL